MMKLDDRVRYVRRMLVLPLLTMVFLVGGAATATGTTLTTGSDDENEPNDTNIRDGSSSGDAAVAATSTSSSSAGNKNALLRGRGGILGDDIPAGHNNDSGGETTNTGRTLVAPAIGSVSIKI